MYSVFARNSRTELRLKTLTLADNYATEEFDHFGICIYIHIYICV